MDTRLLRVAANSSNLVTDAENFGLDSDDDDALAALIDSIEVSGTAGRSNDEAAIHDATPQTAGSTDQTATRSGTLNLNSISSAALANTPPKVRQGSPGRIQWEHSVPSPADEHETPLNRFRTAPRKPLSVTDMISPAWCEIQYLYSLSRFGRVRPTPAMQRGSSVHRELEEQVHQTVPIDVETREDHWGLKLWNVIQGLRMLRATGMTRELEVWGTIEGQTISGIIDELSYTCPDDNLEEVVRRREAAPGQQRDNLPAQMTISDFFATQRRKESSVSTDQHRKVFITDVKTRNSNTLPNSVSMRPARYQLMLYRKLLTNLATNQVEAAQLFARHSVDPRRHFSDTLVQQLGSLDLNFSQEAHWESTAPMESHTDTVVELTAHHDLNKLWMLMMEEFQKTFPGGADSVGKTLNIEYRSSDEGRLIGNKAFIHDDAEIDNYVAEEMKMWKGERAPRGVDIEEAFKCRICEFAEDCGWRKQKLEQDVVRSRAKKSTTRAAPASSPPQGPANRSGGR